MIDERIPFLIIPEILKDSRGTMGVLEDKHVPFEVLRTFWICQAPENTERGGHAHRSSKQLLICIDGNIEVELEDITGGMHQYKLRRNEYALYLPPLCWGRYAFRGSAKALCLASDYFDESDYIRDYQEFKKITNANRDI